MTIQKAVSVYRVDHPQASLTDAIRSFPKFKSSSVKSAFYRHAKRKAEELLKQQVATGKKKYDFVIIPKKNWQPFREFVGYIDEAGTIHKGEAVPEPIDQDTGEYKGILWYQEEGFQIIELNENILILWPRGHGKTWLLAWYIEWNMKHSAYKCMYLSITDVINDVADWVFLWAWDNNLLAEGDLVEKAIRRNTPKTFNLVNGSKFKIYSVMDKAIRGKHDYVIFMDDVIEEGSETHPSRQRELERRWDSTLSKIRRSKLVIVNTRVYEGDFIQYLVDQFDRKHEIMKTRRPEKAHLWSLTIDVRTPYLDEEQTKLLAPELYTLEHFEAMKAENIRTFYSEMMQDPRPQIGGMWEESDIHYVNSWIDFRYYDRCAIAVDFAWSEKETSNYTAIITLLRVEASLIGQLGYKYLVIWEIIARMPVRTVLDHNTNEEKEGILESIQRTFELAQAYFPEHMVSILVPVEMNSGGKIIVDQARREMDIFTFAEYIVEVNHRKDKVKRIEAESEQPVKNGTMSFLKGLKDGLLIDQMLVFPKGKFDDGPDAMSMGKNELTKAGISVSEINRMTAILKERREKEIMADNVNAMGLQETLDFKYNRKRKAMF